MDAYRNKNKIILWLKSNNEDIRIEKEFGTEIYLEINKNTTRFLKNNKIKHKKVFKNNYFRKPILVYEISITRINDFEKIVSKLEEKLNYDAVMYNADIKPEQMFLFRNRLIPFNRIELNTLKCTNSEPPIPLKKATIKVIPKKYIKEGMEIKRIVYNDVVFEGSEEQLLKSFIELFQNDNPDVILMDYAFSRLPYLEQRLNAHNLTCNFHRWDSEPIKYKGGRPFYSYGRVRYQDYSIRLKGRFLVDNSTMVGNECDIEAVVELCQLTGVLFQQLASRSFGAAFQGGLVKQMIEQNLLVPYKEKPIEKPFNMAQMLKTDRGAHNLDSKTGFHTDVAEIDFASMFPWIIWLKNLSADTILANEGPFEKVPDVPIQVSRKYKGLVPLAIKPIIDRRMYYKANPTAQNKLRSKGLKWVLVTSYGYLRFREFKMGIASAHMAICAYARDILLQAVHLAEEKGFEVVHGIIDSLYIKKKNISEENVRDYCGELERLVGIPVSFEGIFRWIVFLPSVENIERPVPTKYYGVFKSGDLKVRGIELRQKNVPVIVKQFQLAVLSEMAKYDRQDKIANKTGQYAKLLRQIIKELPFLEKEFLISKISISKTDYVNNIPQKIIIKKLQDRGIEVLPGQIIEYIFQNNGPVLPDDYNGRVDIEQYKKLLTRSLFTLLQPFGATLKEIIELTASERQKKITEYYEEKLEKFEKELIINIKKSGIIQQSTSNIIKV